MIIKYIKKIIPIKVKLNILLSLQYLHDLNMYRKHSSVIEKDTFGKVESEITLRYHSIEKGFLHNPIRHRFAKARVEGLILLLTKIELNKYKDRIHIQSALLNLCKYYDYHLSQNVDISDYFNKNDYNTYRQLLFLKDKPINYHTKKLFFQYKNSDFSVFSTSRASVRNFTGEKITFETMQKVVDLANHAPSVCNRQPVNVHLIENKILINKILEVQDGLQGYSDKLSQLIVVTSDRNYFYSVGERNQLYIDGGIYVMNLLYALHFYNIGACPAHWGLPYQADEIANKLLNLKPSEQIISLIAIGIPTDEFSTTLSLRKSSKENLLLHN